MDQKDIEMKVFMRDWMHDVGKHQLPDLADFKSIWEEAQKLNINNYFDYLNYKEDPIHFPLKPKISFTDYIKNLPPREDSNFDAVIIPEFSTPKNIQGKNITIEESNNQDNKINSKVKSLIQGEKEIIENGQWEELSDKFCKYNFYNEDIAEFYQMMKASDIIIPQEIKEIILINRLNKLIAKLRGNQDRYNTFFTWMKDEGIYSTLETLWEHTYNFNKEEFKNILFKYRDKLIIPIEELKF